MPRLAKDNLLPTAITNIRLGAALQHSGARSVAEAFDKSEAETLFVYDDCALGRTDWTMDEPDDTARCFRADNPHKETIAMLPLDGYIITGTNTVRGGVCDGMLLTEKDMTLIEFKTNVTSANRLTILQRAQEAIDQLWHTYDGIIRPACASKDRTLDDRLAVDFHVVFHKAMLVTAINAELMDLQSMFLESNGLPLYFDSQKTFL